ncbi:coat protein [ssRNA phage Gerhypos.3_23]|uniref:Coat protein n=2 Tax=Norzivirales TaxID=2842247 RepID=A0A8S5L1J6_9VIRU|nr:coat protein [ssRNA phage Gerhypos.3_23]QDH88280.1 MAG: hypothetical protein H3Bulk42324_000004 [Leviviridae sp.]DAD51355.1 TPA_asm: coat protein [ssRNA phage Gerhypos.3_23]
MSLTINAKTFTADSFQKDQVGYIGTGKTVSVKDDASLSRTAPKPTTTFSGLARTEAKLTRTLTLTGALTPTGDAIIRILVAVPVGYASADVDTLLNDFGAFLASASFKSHVKSQQVSF